MTFGEIAVLVVAVLVIAAAIYFRKKPQALQAAEQSVQDAFKSGVQHASDIIAQHTQHTVAVINATSNAIAQNQPADKGPQTLPHVVTNAERYGSAVMASMMGKDPNAPADPEKPADPVPAAPPFTDFRDFPGRSAWTDRDIPFPSLTVRDGDSSVEISFANYVDSPSVTIAGPTTVTASAPDMTVTLPPGKYSVTPSAGRFAVEMHFA